MAPGRYTPDLAVAQARSCQHCGAHIEVHSNGVAPYPYTCGACLVDPAAPPPRPALRAVPPPAVPPQATQGSLLDLLRAGT